MKDRHLNIPTSDFISKAGNADSDDWFLRMLVDETALPSGFLTLVPPCRSTNLVPAAGELPPLFHESLDSESCLHRCTTSSRQVPSCAGAKDRPPRDEIAVKDAPTTSLAVREIGEKMVPLSDS